MNGARCFNCDKSLDDCKCNDRYTFDNGEGPICPHCGHLQDASYSEGALYDESTNTYTCDNCEEEVDVRIFVSYSWTARPSKG